MSRYLVDSTDPHVAAVELTSIEFAWRRPDSLVIDEPDWFQVTTPSSAQFFLNGVAFSRVDGPAGPARIRAAIEGYRARRAEFRWTVGPSSRPADLDAVLRAEGLCLESECIGMVRPTDPAAFGPRAAGGASRGHRRALRFRVERLP